MHTHMHAYTQQSLMVLSKQCQCRSSVGNACKYALSKQLNKWNMCTKE